MLRVPVGRGAFPPDEQLEVVTLATSKTSEHDCVASQWSLDDLAAELVNRHADEAMTRSTIWRVLTAADIKPHRSVYWLNSHDPDFDAKAQDICKLYVQAPVLYEHGELVICTDEKTGMQILQRKHPTILVEPGKPEKREHEYIRHGARCLIASFVVPTGKVVWDLGVTRTSVDFATHLAHVASQFPDQQRCHWILDNLNTHKPQNDRWLKRHPNVRFHFTPTRASWLNQVEIWFGVLSRRLLRRGEFRSVQELAERILAFIAHYDRHHAHPYEWTYTGKPLVSGDAKRKRKRLRYRRMQLVNMRTR